MAELAKIYTIGHSDRSSEELQKLLQHYAIHTLVDIRAYPYSRRFPHFSMEAIRQTMDDANIIYHWGGKQLGGMREPKQAGSHPGLENASMRGYAEYMQSPLFEKTIVRLINLARKSSTAIMCAEKHACNCHRSLLSDYLLLKNVSVQHIVDDQTVEAHQLNIRARMESATLIYDRNVSGSFDF